MLVAKTRGGSSGERTTGDRPPRCGQQRNSTDQCWLVPGSHLHHHHHPLQDVPLTSWPWSPTFLFLPATTSPKQNLLFLGSLPHLAPLLPSSCQQHRAKRVNGEPGGKSCFHLGKFCCCFRFACQQKLKACQEAAPNPVITGGASDSAPSWSYTVWSLYYSVLFYYSVWFGSCLRNLRLLELYILRSLKSVDRNSFKVFRPESTLLILKLRPISLAGQLTRVHSHSLSRRLTGEAVAYSQPKPGHHLRERFSHVDGARTGHFKDRKYNSC